METNMGECVNTSLEILKAEKQRKMLKQKQASITLRACEEYQMLMIDFVRMLGREEKGCGDVKWQLSASKN